MKNKKAAIIIVNWNGKKFLKNCLTSVFNQSYKNFDVYLVDNGSVDGSVEYVKRNFKKVKLIQLDKNYGYAGGNNRGIERAFEDKKVEYIVCLNNDTIVKKNWLKELVKTAEKSKNIGMVQSKIFLGDGKRLHSVGTILNYDFSSESKGFMEVGKNKYNEDTEIEMAIGGSFLIKRGVLREIGLFEEKFGSYKEDDDLSLRCKLAGYKIFYSSKSILTHLHSGTLSSQSPAKVYLNERNRILNLITYGRFNQIIFSHIFTLRRYLKSKKILKNSNKNNKLKIISALLKAYIISLYYIPYFLKKRKALNLKYKNEI